VPDFAREEFPIFATADGAVRSVEGGTVLIEYADGLFARMFHVQDIRVVPGEVIVRGQQIGTGRAR
jgi:murein DD-endopeptidase MepM/ murein hydrolase activator NlpD